MTWDDIDERLQRARKSFLDLNAELLMVDANERTLTAKFAEYVQEEFPEWHVDCEYNRRGGAVKQLHWRRGQQRGKPPSVIPDIIVHRRRTTDNLLVIEAKKDESAVGDDLQKLDAFKSDAWYRYTFAAVLIFRTGKTPDVLIQQR